MKKSSQDYVFQAIKDLGIYDDPLEFCKHNMTVYKVASAALKLLCGNIKEYTMRRQFDDFEEADKFVELYIAKNIGHILMESGFLKFERKEERGIVTLTGRVLVFDDEQKETK